MTKQLCYYSHPNLKPTTGNPTKGGHYDQQLTLWRIALPPHIAWGILLAINYRIRGRPPERAAISKDITRGAGYLLTVKSSKRKRAEKDPSFLIKAHSQH